MFVVFALFVHLHLGLIRCSVNTPEMNITCEAGTFTAGERASVTCMFDTDMSIDKRGILMEHHVINSTEKDALVCHWRDEQQTHQCTAADGSPFDAVIKDRLELEIPTASKGNAGRYICYTIPPKGTKSQFCNMTIRERSTTFPDFTTLPESTTLLESTTTVGTDNYTKDDSCSSTFLVLFIISVVVAPILGACVIILYRSRRARLPPNLLIIPSINKDTERLPPNLQIIPSINKDTEIESPQPEEDIPLLPGDGDNQITGVQPNTRLKSSNQLKLQKSKKLVEDFRLSSRESKKLAELLNREMEASTTRSVCEQSSNNKADTSIVIEISADHTTIHLVKLQGAHITSMDESRGIPTPEELQKPVTCTDIPTESMRPQPGARKTRYDKPMNIRTSAQLFDHVADCVKRFVKDQKLSRKTLRVDLLIPFQDDKELHWTDETGGHWKRTPRSRSDKAAEARAHLQYAFTRIAILCNLEVGDIASNDVSTLFWAGHMDPNCKIALDVDEVYNACYAKHEQRNADGSDNKHTNKMVHKVDFGAIWENASLEPFLTNFDITLDTLSDNPGNRYMEKLVCIKYQGEIIRLILDELDKTEPLFGSDRPFSKRGVFTPSMVSLIECETDQDFPVTKYELKKIQVDNCTTEDCRIVQYVTRVVLTRAAHLLAAGVATLINHIGQPEETVVVAIGGSSLGDYHPHFKQVLEQETLKLVGPGLKFKIISCVRSEMGTTLRSTAYEQKDQT